MYIQIKTFQIKNLFSLISNFTNSLKKQTFHAKETIANDIKSGQMLRQFSRPNSFRKVNFSIKISINYWYGELLLPYNLCKSVS